jgi:hypothetical protein
MAADGRFTYDANMSESPTPERSVAKLSRGLVGWSILGVIGAFIVAGVTDVSWGADLVAGTVLIAVIAVPVRLIGIALAPKLQDNDPDPPSRSERVVTGVAVAITVVVLVIIVGTIAALSSL